MSENVAQAYPGKFRQLMHWANRVGLAGKVALGLAVCAALSGIATYVVFTQPTGGVPRATSLVVGLLYIDLVLLIALGALVARRLVQVWLERRRGSAGSRLHIRLVVLFSLVALTPAVIVATFSTLVFNFGLQNWFSERVRTAVTDSQQVAEAYLREHRRNIAGDLLAMASDINRQGPALVNDPAAFNRLIDLQTQLRSLSEAVVFEGSGRVLGHSEMTFSLAFEPAPTEAMEKARNGGVVYLSGVDDERIRAMVSLDRFVDTYLMVGRFVDARVIDRIEQTQSAVSAYRSLERVRADLQTLFALIFIVVALLLLFAAIWVGLNFANQLAHPIASLAAAAERVRAGDLTARVVEEGNDEITSLSRAFNRMTSQLETQRAELVEANRQIDLRRRFMEAVLSGVSAGVIGLDADGLINFPNQSASHLLNAGLEDAIGKSIVDLVPEMSDMLARARRQPAQIQEAEIEIQRGGRPRTLLVRITVERSGKETRGFVVTFDDITELISAQRKAAWADVARRLAHEIKNPLTPIQLAAERLRRRYLAEVKSDPETFSTCIDTIIRQVDDIGGMISEFSAFARMPAPKLKRCNLATIVRQATFLQKNANGHITYDLDVPDEAAPTLCDPAQVGQALTNLLQNAVDSINGRLRERGGERGRIEVQLRRSDDRITVTVADNGLGLPKNVGRDLTDPYVTTRAEGTGLGLAIVRKIMEDHGGELILEDRDGAGASIGLIFPASGPETVASEPDERDNPATKTAAHGS